MGSCIPSPPLRSKKRQRCEEDAAREETVQSYADNKKTVFRWPSGTQLSSEDKAPLLELDDNNLTAIGRKGYKTVLATHSTKFQGCWYFEATIESLGETGAVRLGWGTRDVELQTPVGTSEHGYAYRSLDGSAVHQGTRKLYGKAFGVGDTVGCLLYLPIPREVSAGTWVDDHDGPGFVEFYVNGQSQGIAFTDIKRQEFYPAVSLFTDGHQLEPVKVRLNFGQEPFRVPFSFVT